jgi:transcriptional regulator with XRE-family HTH domain
MGMNPTKAAGNIYCQARKEAAKYNDRLSSREGAAEMLGISASTLADYELGITKIIPADAIMRMADLYNAPELRNHYCRNCCPLGGDVPQLEMATIDRITIKAVAQLGRMQTVKENLLAITEDGTITSEEKPQLEEVLKSLDELSAVAQNLRAWLEKNT